jgi:hypothetical protein
MTREEEITQVALEMYSGAVSGHLAMRVGFETGAEWADRHPKLDFKEIYDWLNTYTNMTFDQLDAFEKEFGPSKPFTCNDCDKVHCSRSQYVMSHCSKLED